MSRNHEQPTDEIDPREIVTAYLERERAAWLPAHQRAARDGFMNAALNAEADEHMRKIDTYLEELHALGGTAVSNVIRLDHAS